jgi:hypothetical protein
MLETIPAIEQIPTNSPRSNGRQSGRLSDLDLSDLDLLQPPTKPPKRNYFAALQLLCLWPFAPLSAAQWFGRFQGQNGHDATIAIRSLSDTLMTLN